MMTMSIENTIICFIIGSILLLQTTSTTDEIAQLVGRKVYLNCPKSSPDGILWRFNENTLLYVESQFRGAFKGRSVFETDAATGKGVLKISNIQPGDAGLYKCFDASTDMPLQSTQLTVLGSEPTCDSSITDNGFSCINTCGNTDRVCPDNMRFDCAVSYYGTTPRLQWETANENQGFKNCTSDENQPTKWINCTLTLKAEPQYDGSNFRCKVMTSHGEQYNCSTKAIKVILQSWSLMSLFNILVLVVFATVSYFLLENEQIRESSITKLILLLITLIAAIVAAVVETGNLYSLWSSYGMSVKSAIFFFVILIAFACTFLFVFAIGFWCIESSCVKKARNVVNKLGVDAFVVFCIAIAVSVIVIESLSGSVSVIVITLSAVVCGTIVLFRIVVVCVKKNDPGASRELNVARNLEG